MKSPRWWGARFSGFGKIARSCNVAAATQFNSDGRRRANHPNALSSQSGWMAPFECELKSLRAACPLEFDCTFFPHENCCTEEQYHALPSTTRDLGFRTVLPVDHWSVVPPTILKAYRLTMA